MKQKIDTINQYIFLTHLSDGRSILGGHEWENSIYLGIGSGRNPQEALIDLMTFIDLTEFGLTSVMCFRVQGRNVTLPVPVMEEK